MKADSSIVAWGYQGVGACDVPEPNAGFVAVAAGASHGLGLKADSTIVAWGSNSNGQCEVPEPNTGFVAVAAGAYHSLGLKADGTIVAWGSNDEGQCDVPDQPHNSVWIAAGGYHSVALSLTGACCLSAYCLLCTRSECVAYGGTFEGTGHACDPNPCPTSSVDGETSGSLPLTLRATPNPSTGAVTVEYHLPKATEVTIEIFNAAGVMVRRLCEGEWQAGQRMVTWDGCDATGREIPSGVYLARIMTGDRIAVGRAVIAR